MKLFYKHIFAKQVTQFNISLKKDYTVHTTHAIVRDALSNCKMLGEIG